MTLSSFRNFIVPSYGAIGDFVLMLYLFEGIHHCVPEMPIYVITTRNDDLLRELVGNRTYIHIMHASPFEIFPILFSTFFSRNLFFVPPTFTRVPLRVRALARLFTVMHGATVGFSGFPDYMKYDKSVPFDMKQLVHDNFKNLLLFLGCRYEGSPYVELTEDTIVLSGISHSYIVMAPFAAQPGKSLPPSRWVDLMRRVYAAYPDHTLMVLGAPNNAAAAAQMLQLSGHARSEIFCNQKFAQTISLIKHANLFIGVDSGLSHVAGVLKTPSVIIGNLRSPSWLTTYNPNAIILTKSAHCGCHGDKTGECSVTFEGKEYLRCMMEVSQEMIENAIRTILGSTTAHE